MCASTFTLKTFLPVLFALALSACDSGSSTPKPAATTEGLTLSQLSAVETLGQKIFNDDHLSEPAGMSCTTCHAVNRAFTGPANPSGSGSATVAPGIIAGTSGLRNVPTAAYSLYSPAFTNGSDGPSGGQFYDGRAVNLAEQAKGPFLNADEMANTSKEMVISKIRSAAYVNEFIRVWGTDSLNDSDQAYERVAASLAAFEKTAQFHRFNAKYDFFLAGRVALTQQEARGLALFNDKTKGNCAACHPSMPREGGSPPLFTDFSYDNLGVPRNNSIAANLDHAFYDLGLCGPNRSDISDPKLCGKFKVPTLRNIALTAPYMHNGFFQNLRDVVEFYATRDTNPSKWYTGAVKFDDLPAQYLASVNTKEVPLNRSLGDSPALNAQDIDDIVAFLNTLTDGFNVATGTAQ
jgi:cytochrome c peroxidase